MVPTLPLLSCESSVAMKEISDRKKNSRAVDGFEKALAKVTGPNYENFDNVQRSN